MGGSLCYVELATLVRESGGAYAYIKEGMGGPPAYVAAWMSTIQLAASSAIICLACGSYLLSPLFTCGIPVSKHHKNILLIIINIFLIC